MRRLRAKLGPEHESLIGTVRNVGYRFVAPEKVERAAEEARAEARAGAHTQRAVPDVLRMEQAEEAQEAAVRPARR